MQHWGECISYKRFGYQSTLSLGMRSEFIRDYDRIIFLSAFRRLQDKTQVFPLPGNVFVHNRLTHSLEVASVGRSLGALTGLKLTETLGNTFSEEEKSFYNYELSGIVASACLAHDLGNPAFGHSGEKAIGHYFETNADTLINNTTLKSMFSEVEWQDLTHFEGNANALRLLTRQFKGKLGGGHRLMMVTLASILKYPCASTEVNHKFSHTKKFGYFQSDKSAFDEIVQEFDMTNETGGHYRHPFVYLVEAADDICYRTIDMEDAHRIGIFSRELMENHLLTLLSELGDQLERTKGTLNKIEDNNEAIAYLRAKTINAMVKKASEIFMDNKDAILNGQFNSTLVDEIEKQCPSLSSITDISVKRIYNHPSVIQVELAGYNVMSELLSVFVEAILAKKRTALQKKCILLIPHQYNFAEDDVSAYEKTMSVLDFVSGMTDGYATEMYRYMKGIDLPGYR